MSVLLVYGSHKIRKKKSAKKPPIEPIICPNCDGRADLMRRTPHPNIKGEIWTFECRKCGRQSEKSKLD
jgi:ribosomal protein L37AE/L43A